VLNAAEIWRGLEAAEKPDDLQVHHAVGFGARGFEVFVIRVDANDAAGAPAWFEGVTGEPVVACSAGG
jgi:hypothetical protein